MDAFDKHFRSVFDNHEVPLDTEALWQQVEPRISRRRLPRGIFFLLVAAGLVTTLFLLFDQPEGVAGQTEPESAKSERTVFGRKGQLIRNITAELPVKKDASNTAVNPKTEIASSGQKVNSLENSKPSEAVKDFFFPNDLNKDNDDVAESEVISMNPEAPGESRDLFSTKKVATNTRIQPVISLFPNAAHSAAVKPLPDHPFRLSLDVFAGIDYSSKLLQAKSYDHEWYRKERLATESFLESFNLGIQLNLTHQSGWIAGSGLMFRQVDELFVSESSGEIRTFVEGVVEIITHADGSSTVVTGQKLVLSERKWNKRKYNTYRFINLPVFVGYAFSSGMLRYEMTTGLDLNLRFLKEGEIIGDEGFPVSVSDPQNSIFNKYSSVGLTGSVKLLYPVSDEIIIYASPHFHYDLMSITKTAYPLEQRYFHCGIRLGTRIRF